MTADQRKELYDVLDYDEKAALVDSLQLPRDALVTRITAKLDKGSFTLTTDPHGIAGEVVSITFVAFQADTIQRPDSIEASISLGGFGVFDGTSRNTLYPQIVQVKDGTKDLKGIDQQSMGEKKSNDDAFFFAKFESNPLDKRANTALTVRMRQMEVIYHKGFVEAIYMFLKPPESHLESVGALLVSLFVFIETCNHKWCGITRTECR
jgi:vacuolar protein sorting-associated protein 13A/C